jgi:hypothetical protein
VTAASCTSVLEAEDLLKAESEFPLELLRPDESHQQFDEVAVEQFEGGDVFHAMTERFQTAGDAMEPLRALIVQAETEEFEDGAHVPLQSILEVLCLHRGDESLGTAEAFAEQHLEDGEVVEHLRRRSIEHIRF